MEEKIGGVGLEDGGKDILKRPVTGIFTIQVRESKAQHTLSQRQDVEGRIRMHRGF